MKKDKVIICLVFSWAIVLNSCINVDNKTNVSENNNSKSNAVQFDSLAVIKYGADQYGMRKYVIAFLKKGTNDTLDSARSYALQVGHMKNIRKMADEGKLAVAGPFLDNGEFRGLYILNTESLEEAEILTNSDPAIKEGVLSMDLKEWYGTAALMAVNDIHKTLSKQQTNQEEE